MKIRKMAVQVTGVMNFLDNGKRLISLIISENIRNKTGK